MGDNYSTTWGDARGQFYSIWSDGVPWFAYDGLFDAWPINTYTSKLVQRQAVPTPVTLQVGLFQLSGLNYRIQIRACLEETATPVTLRSYAVVIQDRFPGNPSYSRNTFRTATATQDFTLTPGACHFEYRDVTLDASWTLSNLGVIAWVQLPQGVYPAEVYQAAKDLHPFAPVVVLGDMNCDGMLSFADINPFVQSLTDGDAWAAAYPGCVIDNGDVNDDGAVDFGDINPFVALLTQ